VHEVVVNFVNETMECGDVREVQLWGCRLRIASPSNSDTLDFLYVLGQSSSHCSSEIDKLDWILTCHLHNFLNYRCNLSFRKFLLAIVWLGRNQELVDPCPIVKTLLIFCFVFGLMLF